MEIISALYREIYEEMAFVLPKDLITLEDRVFTHMSPNGKVLHFFAKELPLHVFEAIERVHTSAQSFPKESLGIFRVPLGCVGQTSSTLFRKFIANFSNGVFAGNAKKQFIETIIRLKLIGEKDIEFLEQNKCL